MAASWKASLLSLLAVALVDVSCNQEGCPTTSSQCAVAAPSNLLATAVSATEMDLSWTDNSANEDGFHIERAPGWTTSFTEIATVAVNVTSYQNTGLTEANYDYRVRAYNAIGTSDYTNTATAGLAAPSNGIAFWRQGPQTGYSCGGLCEDIWLMNANGSHLSRLTTNPARDLESSWSPDGRRIAFHTTRDGDNAIYVMNWDGTGEVRLNNGFSYSMNPAWSPDGKKIAFLYGAFSDSAVGIAVMNPDGTGVVLLTKEMCYPTGCRIPGHPTWSPDGNKIAFDTPRDGPSEVYVMNADGTGQTNLTNNPADDFEPAWSPDGQKIAFVSGRDDMPNCSFDVFVMNADGTSPTNLTNSGANLELDPAWSPDGEKIVYSSGPFRTCSGDAGISAVTIMNADGTNQVRLDNSGYWSRYPAWRP